MGGLIRTDHRCPHGSRQSLWARPRLSCQRGELFNEMCAAWVSSRGTWGPWDHCLQHAQPSILHGASDRPTGSKMIPSFCHRRSHVCGINSVVGQNGALLLKLERCRGVAGDPSEACLSDRLARPWGAFPGRAPLSYPRIRISRSAHGADSDAAPGHGREGRDGRGLTPAGGFQGPSLSWRRSSVSLCWFKQMLWSSCPGEGVIPTQGLLHAFRELVLPLEWAGGESRLLRSHCCLCAQHNLWM